MSKLIKNDTEANLIVPPSLRSRCFVTTAGTYRIRPCRGEVTSPLQKPTLGKIVAYFKYQSTKLINEIHVTPGNRFWQRNYYEHIIRSDKELNNIREYIVNNPMQWNVDEENPMKEDQKAMQNDGKSS